MRIFGIKLETRRELKQALSEFQDKLALCENKLTYKQNNFPFDLGQVVYDVALKNEKGRYTKANPSIEHSTINKVTVNEKNYFRLVDRFNNNDVFFSQEDAEDYLISICN